MKRLKRAEKQAETRSLLIDAAAKAFAERGYAAASIDAIAEKAGFSKGAFYSNFASKEDLVLAVLQRTMLSRTDLLAAAVASAGDDPARLIEAVVAESVDRQEDRSWNMLRLELLRHAARDPRLRAAVAAHCDELLSANTRLISDAREHLGLAPLPQPRLLADTFLATALGASLLRYADVELAPVGMITLVMLSLMVGEDPVTSVLAVTGRKKPNSAGSSRARRR